MHRIKSQNQIDNLFSKPKRQRTSRSPEAVTKKAMPPPKEKKDEKEPILMTYIRAEGRQGKRSTPNPIGVNLVQEECGKSKGQASEEQISSST